MARKFLWVPTLAVGNRGYIVAEVAVGAETEGLAQEFAGPEATILTEAQLISTEDGRRALAAWRANDDRLMDTDSRLVAYGGVDFPQGLRPIEKPLTPLELNMLHERNEHAFLLADDLLKRNQRLRSRMRRLLQTMQAISEQNRKELSDARAQRPKPAARVIPIRRGKKAG
jgi:hypothetical protein